MSQSDVYAAVPERSWLLDRIREYLQMLIEMDNVPDFQIWKLVKETEYEDVFLKKYGFSSRQDADNHFSVANTIEKGVL